MHLLRCLVCGLTLTVVLFDPAPLRSQRVRFPGAPNPAAVTPPAPVTLGTPTATPFDPYALGPSISTVPVIPPSGLQTPVPTFQPPPIVQGPLVIQGGPLAGANVAPALPPPALPGQAYPSTSPPAIFPDGLFSGWNSNSPWLSPFGAATAPPPYERLFEDFFLRYTWLYAEPALSNRNSLEQNDVEMATSMVFPGFFDTNSEIRITPGFILTLLHGPWPAAAPVGLSQGLPNRTYSAYLDSHFRPQVTPVLGGELNARVGVYTDFEHVTRHSIRVTGRGLVLVKLTPTATLKGGVEYINRVDLKMFPAGGVLWEPNPQRRWDIYFPRPKLANYATTIADTEIWWYVGAEYGGGSWTIKHPDISVSDRIDINDIRAFLGFDFTRPSGFTGFVEGGYVFEREIIYVSSVVPDLKIDDTFMLRAGFIW